MERHSGVVIKITGSWYRVLAEDGNSYDCRIKGKFRLSSHTSTNPITIGDKVHFHSEDKIEYAVIDKIEERKNTMFRKSTNLTDRTQLIAANIDYVCIITTLVNPPVSSGFLDRYLVLAEAYYITPIIIFNKADLYGKKELVKLKEWQEIYNSAGYQWLVVSAKTGQQIEELKKLIIGKVSLFTGQSGVGKSTLLNYIDSSLNQRTSSLSGYTGKGKHTTTFYEMFKLADNTFIIDSPGIKELGLYDMEPYEISRFFPEFREIIGNCRFNTCLHRDEPGCALLDALESGKVSEQRYVNYLNMLDGIHKKYTSGK